MPSRARMILIALVCAGTLAAQQQPPRTAAPAAPTSTIAPMSGGDPVLARIEQAAQATAAEVGKLRIDKWKTDSQTKQQSQQNAESLSRNINAALPGMIQAARQNPSSVAAEFKLYRNLNALYDVLTGLAESAGAFGQKNEYQALGTQLNAFDQARLELANRLESMTAQQDAEIARLHTQAATTAKAAPAPAPKKIIVDDTAPTTSTKKKPAAKKKPPTTPSQP